VLRREVLDELDAMIRRGEIRRARKRIDQERRLLLEWGDAEGLRQLEFPAGCLGERGDDLAYAIRQNVLQVERAAQLGVSDPEPRSRSNLTRAIAIWLLVWPLVVLGYPFFAAAGGGQTEHGLVVFAIVLAVYWLLPLGVICTSWGRGKTDLTRPLLGWALLPLMISLLGIPYLWRSVRRELRLRPMR
jgi:hypothetical protein